MFTRWVGLKPHTIMSLLFVSLPFSVVYTLFVRRYAIDGLFGAIGDVGPLKLGSLRVLARRRPRWYVTVWSALLAGGSHLLLDTFTHQGRWGSRLAGFDETLFEGPTGSITTAQTLQYLGHTVGSLIGIVLFSLIAARHLPMWYGADQVEAARGAPVWIHGRRLVAAAVSIAAIGGLIATQMRGVSPFFFPGFTVVIALAASGGFVQALSRR